MSEIFRELLKKVGSGTHTGKDLSRPEAEAATRMILLQEATPAQIGAFMIAHRIKRPTSEELAGMLDAYDQLGPHLQPIDFSRPVFVLGIPYDGRSRTAPIGPLTALILTAAGCPVVLHGGNCTPTKYGTPLIDIWKGLGIHWEILSLDQVQQVLAQTLLGFVYLPQHFPLAQGLVTYRDQIGKRPPFATMELMWNPYLGDAHVVSGYVHPPTEALYQETFAIRGTTRFTTVKGLEGSCDLPRDRTAIIGVNQPEADPSFQRLLLAPRDYGFAGSEIPLGSTLVQDMQAVLVGKPSALMEAAIWNSGFYLWQSGLCPDLQAGFTQAENILTSGQALKQLKEVHKAVTQQKVVSV